MLLSATRNPRDAIFDIFISRLQVSRAQFPLARPEKEAQAPKRLLSSHFFHAFLNHLLVFVVVFFLC